MYYYLRGNLVLCEDGAVAIDCMGVAYKLFVSAQTIGKLAGKMDEEVKIYTHLSVREDAMELYGFHSEDEYRSFKMLIGVSGIGPKAALSILSSLPPEKLAAAVVSGDTKLISRANGIGPKTAARVVLELKDKISKELGAPVSKKGLEDIPSVPAGGAYADALAALMVLGYSRAEASGALSGIDPSLDCEGLVREALKKLFSAK